jgi:hypothetical protein
MVQKVTTTKNPEAFQVELAQEVVTTTNSLGTGNTFGFLPERSSTQRSWPTFTRSILVKLGVLPEGPLSTSEDERGKQVVNGAAKIDLAARYQEVYGKNLRMVIVETQEPAIVDGRIRAQAKINPSTKGILFAKGAPIFRSVVTVEDDSIRDTKIQHDSEQDEATYIAWKNEYTKAHNVLVA